MGILEDLQEIWNGFNNWLGSVGQTLSSDFGQLGLGIHSGLSWLGNMIKDAFEWIYNGLMWIGTKLKEAYDILAQWVNTGLQWIGAGLSWLGANLYKIGQWLAWCVVMFVKWGIIIPFKAVFNWFARILVSVWNGLCSIPKNFVEGFNAFMNYFALGLREKFKSLMFVNLTIPIMGKQIEQIPQRIAESNSMWGVAGAILAPFVTPLAALALAEVVDAIVPRPSSTSLTIFPSMSIPELYAESLEISTPEELSEPEMVTETIPPVYETPGTIPYTTAGYVPEGEKASGIGLAYEIDVGYGGQVVKSSVLKTQYEVTLE